MCGSGWKTPGAAETPLGIKNATDVTTAARMLRRIEPPRALGPLGRACEYRFPEIPMLNGCSREFAKSLPGFDAGCKTPLSDDRFGLDLDFPPWVKERAHHDHRGSRPD